MGRPIADGSAGHPASLPYRTQSELWLKDQYHPLLMNRTDIENHLDGRLVWQPT